MRWSRRLLGRALLTAALSAGAALGLVSSAAASTSQPVAIDTTFWIDPQGPGCGVNVNPSYANSFKATGGVFGKGVSGTDCVIAAIGTNTPKTFPFSIVDTIHRTDVFTASDGSGTFTLGIDKVSTFIPGPVCPTMLPNGDQTYAGDPCNTVAYKGSATVKGGTGAYTNLRGTLDFTSKEFFDVNPSVFETVYGTEHMAGSLHIDP
jgi:hypothetical protein